MKHLILFLSLSPVPLLFPAPATAQELREELRFLDSPVVTRFPGGGLEWTARVHCANPLSLQGARLLFFLDRGLDGAPVPADSAALSPGDCGGGELAVRRVLFPPHPAVLRAELRNAEGEPGGSHAILAGGGGTLLSIHRYCARPRDGEPEWIEILNASSAPVSLQDVRVQGRALAGRLEPGESLIAGRDTASLRIWHPGGRLLGTGTWSNLRNAGDTLRLALTGGPTLDSLVYGSGAFPREACASLAEDESAAAFGYALEPSAYRWRRGAAPLEIAVSAPGRGRYDLRAYDLDGLELCVLARGAEGPGNHPYPPPECSLPRGRAGTVLLLLRPRGAPAIRTAIRITE